jgi:HEAT repeat protein
MNDETYHHRFSAIHALGSLGGLEALNFLNNLWKDLKRKNIQKLIGEDLDSIKSQRAFVAAALFKAGDDQHVGYVYELVMSNDKALRYNAASALGMVNTKKSKEILFDVLKNDSMDLPRCGAASALAEHGNKSDFVEVRKIIGDNELLKGCFEDALKE